MRGNAGRGPGRGLGPPKTPHPGPPLNMSATRIGEKNQLQKKFSLIMFLLNVIIKRNPPPATGAPTETISTSIVLVKVKNTKTL